MKIYNITNPQKFYEVVDKCEGRVELVTSEGDRLNLKSKLSQFVSLANLFASKESIPEMEIMTSNPEDMTRLISYVVERKN